MHIAARIGALAEADEVIASREAIDGAERRPDHGELRSERLRGIHRPVEVASLA